MRFCIDAGVLWGRVVAEELQGWRLDTGHIAKKVSENVCPSGTQACGTEFSFFQNQCEHEILVDLLYFHMMFMCTGCLVT